MANLFPAQARISPSFAEPELIVTYAQASGAFNALQGAKPRVKLAPGDLNVYVNSLDIRTETSTAQSSSNLLPSSTLIGSVYSTATYLIRTRTIWDHHEMAAAANYSVSLPAAQDLASRQGIFQQMRSMLLYGYNPANGEGLLNSPSAIAVTLAPDYLGNTTVSTYDNGAMALFILQQIVSLKSGMYQSGGNIKNKIIIISPQRVFLSFQLSAIVQITTYQRPGAGTSTVGGLIENVITENGDEIEWHYDDTLIGKGAGGSDAIILTIPEVEIPDVPGINTNVFGEFTPSMKAVNVMYTDMPAPMKIPTPIPDGGITEVQEIRSSSGWNLRPQGLAIISMPY